jgi:hypothetical protein
MEHPMATNEPSRTVDTFEIRQQQQIRAPREVVFATLLDQLGPGSEMPDGTPFPMKIEPWPGGRWFRDLGNNSGHFWAHVQVIKPPGLLELRGPFFMSYPAINFVQYRLTEQDSGTLLAMTHQAMGMIPAEHRQEMQKDWEDMLTMIGAKAERRAGEKR